MSVTELLLRTELLSGLAPEQTAQIAALGREIAYNAGDTIIHEGDLTDEIYVICSGMVEVDVSQGVPPPDVPAETLVRLGQGQVFGEMSLVDQGMRSATVHCIENGTTLFAIPRAEFWSLCEANHDIGYHVMRNIAADLSFKLRHRNLKMGLTGGAT